MKVVDVLDTTNYGFRVQSGQVGVEAVLVPPAASILASTMPTVAPIIVLVPGRCEVHGHWAVHFSF